MSAELFLGSPSPWPPEPPSRTSGSGSESRTDEPSARSDKACKRCRSRKVKCDKLYPMCQRCRERGESCDYGNMMPVNAVSTEGATRLATLQAKLDAVEQELEDLKISQDFAAASLPENIRRAFVASLPANEVSEQFLRDLTKQSISQNRPRPETVRAQDVESNQSGDKEFSTKRRKLSTASVSLSSPSSESSLDWWLGRKAMARALTIHLVDSFFKSCCAYLPSFESWSNRIGSMLERIDALSTYERIAVTGFAMLGARGSPHSSLLGIEMKQGSAATETAFEAGRRREAAYRSLQKNAVAASYSLGLFSQASIENIEALLVHLQGFLFDELEPRHSKAFLAIAWIQYKDLMDDPTLTPAHRQEITLRLGYPLYLADANIASYSRRSPLIPAEALPRYFRDINLRIPDLLSESIADDIDALLNLPDGTWASHYLLLEASTRVHCWLAAIQRRLGDLASAPFHAREQFLSEVRLIWQALDGLHESARRLQQFLITLMYTPVDCHKDGCQDLHLRFVTRIDRDGQDVLYILHGLLSRYFDRLPPMEQSTMRATVILESESRIRKALKLTTFYMQLYVTSLDRHMTYHLAWQLELLPDWPRWIVQRVGEVGGPVSEEHEVSETELDWLEGGLKVAAFYHPIGERRLHELQSLRQSQRASTSASNAHLTGSTVGPSGRLLSRRERLSQ